MLSRLRTRGVCRHRSSDFFETADIRTDYLFVVYTCGVTPGLGVNIACRQARHRGLQVAYANSIKMVDNNFMLYDVRRQIETADAKDIPGHTAAIAADIAARRHYIALPSVADRLMGICMKAMPSFKGFYRQYRCDTGRCNGCGICARICPVGASLATGTDIRNGIADAYAAPRAIIIVLKALSHTHISGADIVSSATRM